VNWSTWALLAAVIIGVYLSQLAGRLDRLHIRVDRAEAALRAQLLRRASEAIELAAMDGPLDPAARITIDGFAHAARDFGETDLEKDHRAQRLEQAGRNEAEGELTKALQAALPDEESVMEYAAIGGGSELMEELDSTTRRVELAKGFHADAVAQCQKMRRRAIVRFLHLQGRAPWPEFIDINLAQPTGFAHRSR